MKKEVMFVFLIIVLLLIIPIISALPSIIYGPNGIAIAQVSEDGTLIYAGDGTEFLVLNDSNGNVIYREKISPFGVPIEKQGVNPAVDSYDYDVQVYIPKVADPKDVGGYGSETYDPTTAASLSTGQFLKNWGYYTITDAPSNIINCAAGVKQGFTDLCLGTYTLIRHPIQTFEGIATQGFLLYYMPGETLSGYGSAIASAYNENPGYFIGERAVDVGLLTWGVWSRVSKWKSAAEIKYAPTASGQRVFYVDPEGVATVSKGWSSKPTIPLLKVITNPARILPKGKYPKATYPWHTDYPMTSYVLEEDIQVYRLWSGTGKSEELGKWWWFEDPRLQRSFLGQKIPIPKSVRQDIPFSSLALPEECDHLATAIIPKGTRIQVGIAGPIPEWGGFGGAQQLRILESWDYMNKNIHPESMGVGPHFCPFYQDTEFP